MFDLKKNNNYQKYLNILEGSQSITMPAQIFRQKLFIHAAINKAQ